ncbi:hypothetical protein DM860_001867 [Cuscuta australis]|uniref:Uncharacterized protein n=1 Tax=Cuscuta australis TaxID=267555 RepID=A0A328EDS9_9ASTE|nr:hypothetical protein DM860_001867 [Cuscuta australis]
MNLNCLSCHYTRTSSVGGGLDAMGAATNEEDEPKTPRFRLMSLKRLQVDRSWSGNLVGRPPAGRKNETSSSGSGGGKNLVQRRHSGPIVCDTPRLVRSCGMRRDWSFEDLRQKVKA